jgi:hypothetical protein
MGRRVEDGRLAEVIPLFERTLPDRGKSWAITAPTLSFLAATSRSLTRWPGVYPGNGVRNRMRRANSGLFQQVATWNGVRLGLNCS